MSDSFSRAIGGFASSQIKRSPESVLETIYAVPGLDLETWKIWSAAAAAAVARDVYSSDPCDQNATVYLSLYDRSMWSQHDAGRMIEHIMGADSFSDDQKSEFECLLTILRDADPSSQDDDDGRVY